MIWSNPSNLEVGATCGNCPGVLAERMRISREIHDTLMQGCASVSTLLCTALGPDSGDEDTRLHLVQIAAAEIHATVEEARQVITNLRRNGEKHASIVETLRGLTGRVARQHGVDASLYIVGLPVQLDRELVYALTMAAREAVFNAVFHAEMQHIRITLVFESQAVMVTVADDGRGFDQDLLDREEHFGLQNMQERMTAVGGSMSVKSEMGRGTAVSLQLPLLHVREN